jgi:hypothetical protein
MKPIAMRSLWAPAFALCALLGASAAKDDKEKSDAPDPRIGAEVNQICFQRTIDGWRPLRGADNAVLLDAGLNKWYRVELSGGCDGGVFGFAETIAIDSRPGGGCVSRGDVIIAKDGAGFTYRCPIVRIFEWDEDATAPDESEKEAEEGA